MNGCICQLEELKERIQRRKEEKQREADHENWISNQKRELVTKRLQRALARETGGGAGDSANGAQAEQERSYSAESGFVVFWDFVTGLLESTEKLQVRGTMKEILSHSFDVFYLNVSLQATYAVFEGKMIHTPFKALQSQESEPHGLKFKRCLFASSCHLKKLPATLDMRMVIEVSLGFSTALLVYSGGRNDVLMYFGCSTVLDCVKAGREEPGLDRFRTLPATGRSTRIESRHGVL